MGFAAGFFFGLQLFFVFAFLLLTFFFLLLQAFLILTFFLLTQFFTGFEFRLTFGFDLFQLGLAVAFKLFFSFGFCFQQRFFFNLLLLQKFLVFFCLLFLQFFFGFLLSFKSFTSFFLTGFNFIGFALAEFFDLFQREFLRLFDRSDNSGNGVGRCRNNRIFYNRLYRNSIYIRRKERFCFTDSHCIDRRKFYRNRIFYGRRYNNFFYSLLLAFASINLKADQTIGGTALNLLATAVAVVISKHFSDSGSAKLNYSNKPFLFSIGGLELSIFVPLGIALLIISYIVLYKTRFGLRLRACGEHPQAADSVGINVYKMRYAGVVISGALGAIGGLAYIVPPVQTWNFEVGVAGAGFLALAVMIFGQWKPFHICGAAMFFAVFKSLANIADSTFLAQLHWSSNIYNMMPFVASMVILAFTSKNSMAPKAEGIPYDKGSR